MRKLFSRNEIIFLLLILIAFILLRTVNFEYHLNFTADQGEHATAVYQIWKEKDIVLIGNPVTSFRYLNHFIFQGPAYYYMMIPFMLLGQFDPVKSSYLFMLFCSLTLFPLYLGTKYFINRKAAIIFTLIYSLSPYFASYTRFHWNPNYQLSLIPFLILLMGLYKKRPSLKLFFGISFMLGFLLQFHYQFIWVILGIVFYYFVIKRIDIRNAIVLIAGGLLGVSPLILNELNTNFYNFNTLLLFWNHRSEIVTAGGLSTPHYYLGISMFLILGLLGLGSILLKKHKRVFDERLKYSVLAIFAIGLFAWSALLFFPRPTHSFWSYAENWNYLEEYEAYTIIKNENLTNYNIANFAYYDTLSPVIKYLLLKDGIDLRNQDYYSNKYLFVILGNKEDFSKILSYEFTTFSPRKELKKWQLNDYYSLYLFERIPQ